MGSRDFGHKETKKPRKDAKKAIISDIIAPPVTVEVVKKKRKEPREAAE